MRRSNANWRELWRNRFVVYRCFDEAGVLLYVGATRNWPVRMQTHRSRATSFWWPLVRRVKIQICPEPISMETVEKQAIRTEHPLYNLWENFHPSEHTAKIAEWDLQFPGTAKAFEDSAAKVLREKRRRQARQVAARAAQHEEQQWTRGGSRRMT